MRAFVAIDLPDRERDALQVMQARIPAGRLAAADTFHLTLAFLGDVSDDQLEALDDALASANLPRPVVRVAGFGTFGDPVPAVLWAGVQPDRGLSELHTAVRGAARGAGMSLPRTTFRPHVTLARFRGLEGADGRIGQFCADHAAFDLPDFAPTLITLFRSDLGPKGPRHRVLAEYPTDT